MTSFTKLAWSTIGKKILMALTGLALCGFLIVHLAGNMALLMGKQEFFNLYAHKLAELGVMLYLAEIGLVALFLLHAISGLSVTLEHWRARPVKYVMTGNAGGNSQKTISSQTMIYTGGLILLFLILHVTQFKYGPAKMVPVPGGDGNQMKDLFTLVVDTFQSPIFLIAYVAIMALLGFHLRHGCWSAFQSLGANHPRYMPLIQVVGVLFAIVMAVGFLIIPIVLNIRY